MATEHPHSFESRDAMVYVDTYRRLRLEEGSSIERSKQRLMEKYWNVAQAPTRYYAELRAHEHALAFVTRRQEPGLVVLGDIVAEPEPGSETESEEARMIAALSETIKAKGEEIGNLTAQAARLNAQIATMEEEHRDAKAEIANKEQQLRRLRERLMQTNSTFMVVGAMLTLVVIALLYLYLARG